jgi:hypothetical protein
VNKHPGHVDVVTEVGYCSFCNRTRNLRREEHHLGNMVRTIVTCESCHRTLSSTMSVAAPEPAPAPEPKPAEEATPAQAPAEEEPVAAAAPPKRAPAKRATAVKKPSAAKPKSTARTSKKR